MTTVTMVTHADVPTTAARPVTSQDVRKLVRHYGLTGRTWTRAPWRDIARRIMAHWDYCGAYGPRNADRTLAGWAADEWARARAADGLLYTVATGRDAYGVYAYVQSLDRDGVVMWIEQIARALVQSGTTAIGYAPEAINSFPAVADAGLRLGYTYTRYHVDTQRKYWANIVPLTEWPPAQRARSR